jgi:hypothetical protein
MSPYLQAQKTRIRCIATIKEPIQSRTAPITLSFIKDLLDIKANNGEYGAMFQVSFQRKHI